MRSREVRSEEIEVLRTIADHVLDIAQNSVNAGAKNVNVLLEEKSGEYFKFLIEDDGKGMDDSEISAVFDPFFTTRDHEIRRVGLGLPFLKQVTELTGGYVKLHSKKGVGTRVEALFRLDSVDCPPIGDLASTVATLVFSGDGVRWRIERIRDGEVLYEIDSKELEEEYGDLLRTPSFMKRFIEALNEIEGSS